MPSITSFFAPKSKRAALSSAENDGKNEKFKGKRELETPTVSGKGDSKRHKQHCHDAKNNLAPLFSSTNAPAAAKEKVPSSDVKELVSQLRPVSSDATAWGKKLEKHFSSPGFAKLSKFVSNARYVYSSFFERSSAYRPWILIFTLPPRIKCRRNGTVYPPPCDTFSALNLTPLNKVKVVIVGQDPYHGPNQGHGLCFSVRKGVVVPPSLKNIYKELRNDADICFPSAHGVPSHGNLERWAKQGVLLLNSVLTVKRGEAHSHKGRGWELFTDEVIRILDRESRSSGKGLVFLLWGKPASKKAQSIIRGGTNHTIICTSHPSPLGATKTNAPFLGSKCFSRCNSALKELGHEPIDWNVDGDL